MDLWFWCFRTDLCTESCCLWSKCRHNINQNKNMTCTYIFNVNSIITIDIPLLVIFNYFSIILFRSFYLSCKTNENVKDRNFVIIFNIYTWVVLRLTISFVVLNVISHHWFNNISIICKEKNSHNICAFLNL